MELVRSKSDLIGTFASGLCAVHCAITPVLFVIQTCAITGCCTGAPTWWSAIDYVFIGITLLAVYWSAQSTSKNWMRYALYGSWVLLTALIVNEKMTLIPIGEVLKYASAFLLIGLHLINKKYFSVAKADCCVAALEKA